MSETSETTAEERARKIAEESEKRHAVEGQPAATQEADFEKSEAPTEGTDEKGTDEAPAARGPGRPPKAT